MLYLGDLGRTKMRLAVSTDEKTLQSVVVSPTPQDPQAGLEIIKEFVAKHHDKNPGAISLGVSRKLWPDFTLRPALNKLGIGPVFLENDAALVGLGETAAGAAQGFSSVAYITVSTGVGGARFEDGQISPNAMGFEPGQQVIIVDGKVQTLEQLISGPAVEARFGRPPADIHDDQIWQDLSRFLAVGLVNSLLHWSPECLVLGGSMFKVPGFRVDTVSWLIGQYLTIFPRLPAIRLATLGDHGGLLGALTYWRQSNI
jgi:glucokinase